MQKPVTKPSNSYSLSALCEHVAHLSKQKLTLTVELDVVITLLGLKQDVCLVMNPQQVVDLISKLQQKKTETFFCQMPDIGSSNATFQVQMDGQSRLIVKRAVTQQCSTIISMD